VQNELNDAIAKIAAMELLLEEMLGEDKDTNAIISNYIFNNRDKVDQKMDDLYIEMMGNVLSQNE